MSRPASSVIGWDDESAYCQVFLQRSKNDHSSMRHTVASRFSVCIRLIRTCGIVSKVDVERHRTACFHASLKHHCRHQYLGRRASNGTLRHTCKRIMGHIDVILKLSINTHACGSGSQASFTTCLCSPLSFHTTGGSKPCGFEPSPSSPRQPSATQVAHNHVGWEGELARGEDRVEFCGYHGRGLP